MIIGNSYGLVKKDFIRDVQEILELILKHSNNWNMKNLYPKFFQKGKQLIHILKTNTQFEKETFRDLNNFIVDYCNGFSENELHITDIKLYQMLMNYTTNTLWILGYDSDDIIAYSLEN